MWAARALARWRDAGFRCGAAARRRSMCATQAQLEVSAPQEASREPCAHVGALAAHESRRSPQLST